MTGSRKGRRLLDLVVVILLVLGTLIYQAVLWANRGMFQNEFRKPERGILLRWTPERPLMDDLGNAAIADYRLNLLVVFQADDEEGESFIGFPYAVPEGVGFDVMRGEKTCQCVVPKTRDALFLFRPDGTSERRPLQAGETRRIFDRLDYETKDIAAVVERAYSEQHSRSVP